jgi:DNA polymerase-3 subunit beta
MKFLCSKEEFVLAISTVQKAISSKTTLPVLSGVLISAFDNAVSITATDLELGIEAKVECNIEDAGNTVVSARLLNEIIRKLPGKTFTFESDETHKIVIKSDKSVFNLLGMDPSDFPPFPDAKERCIVTFPQEVLKNMIRKTSFAVSQDQSKRVLTGVYLKVSDGEIETVALDGYRVALFKTAVEGCEAQYDFIIPGKTMNELAKIMNDPQGVVEVSTCDNEIIFEIEDTKVASRLISGDYVNFNNFIPTEFKLEIEVEKAVFQDALERAFLMAKEGNNLIKINVADKIIITSNSDSGNVYEEVEVATKNGTDMEIAFNCNYLMDAVKSIDEKILTVKFVDPVGPCLVLPKGDLSQLNLVLPVRLG